MKIATTLLILLVLMLTLCGGIRVVAASGISFGSSSGSSTDVLSNDVNVVPTGELNAAHEIYDRINSTLNKPAIWVVGETDVVDQTLLKETDVSDKLTGDLDNNNIPAETKQEMLYVLDNPATKIFPFQVIRFILDDLKELGIVPTDYPYAIVMEHDDWLTVHIIIPMDEDYKALEYHYTVQKNGDTDVRVTRSISKGGKIDCRTPAQIYKMEA